VTLRVPVRGLLLLLLHVRAGGVAIPHTRLLHGLHGLLHHWLLYCLHLHRLHLLDHPSHGVRLRVGHPPTVRGPSPPSHLLLLVHVLLLLTVLLLLVAVLLLWWLRRLHVWWLRWLWGWHSSRLHPILLRRPWLRVLLWVMPILLRLRL
jgi:hypothetical protein